MPQPFSYVTGQRLTLTVTVLDGRDAGMPIVNLGGTAIPISRGALDAADTRPDAERPRTPEEIDRTKLQDAQDAAAVAQAEREAQAEGARTAEGAAILAKAATDDKELR